MSREHYIRYVNLPPIPNEIVSNLNQNFNEYQDQAGSRVGSHFFWSNNFNHEINDWGQANINSNLYFGFLIATKDAQKHVDKDTLIKINYVISTGGSNVLTRFFDLNGNVVKEYQVEPNRWHIFDASVPHEVINIEPGQTRFLVTAKIF